MKKLYEVKLETTAYVMAESEAEAINLGEEAVREEAENPAGGSLDVREVTHRHWPLDGGWDGDSLVYGTNNDTTIDSVLKTLPEDAAYARLLKLHHSLEPGRVKPTPEEP